MKQQANKTYSRNHGFTLAELVVATTIISIVLGAAYTAFNTTLRTQRLGEENFYAHQEARTALSIITRELNCILSNTGQLFEGKKHEVEFYAVAPSMYINKRRYGSKEDTRAPRVLWIRYHKTTAGKLERDQKFVEGRFERPRNNITPEPDRGRKHTTVLASNVKEFDIIYHWIDQKPHLPDDGTPREVENRTRFEKKNDFPDGMSITLTLNDPFSESGQITFTKRISFMNRLKHTDKLL